MTHSETILKISFSLKIRIRQQKACPLFPFFTVHLKHSIPTHWKMGVLVGNLNCATAALLRKMTHTPIMQKFSTPTKPIVKKYLKPFKGVCCCSSIHPSHKPDYCKKCGLDASSIILLFICIIEVQWLISHFLITPHHLSCLTLTHLNCPKKLAYSASSFS